MFPVSTINIISFNTRKRDDSTSPFAEITWRCESFLLRGLPEGIPLKSVFIVTSEKKSHGHYRQSSLAQPMFALQKSLVKTFEFGGAQTATRDGRSLRYLR